MALGSNTYMPPDHQLRIDSGISPDWNNLPEHRTTLANLAPDATELRFRRIRSSHKGIGKLTNLRRLWAHSVNQEFLDELTGISTIEHLYIAGLTAADLSPLTRLRGLRRLIAIGGTKVENMDWVLGLPPLESLAIENFKRIRSIDALAAQSSLSALGIEGSVWTRMHVDSLAPISFLTRLRALYLTNLTARDRSLRHLVSLKELQVLEIGALFPDNELLRLHEALPNLRCDWFDMIEAHGSTREGIRAAVSKIC